MEQILAETSIPSHIESVMTKCEIPVRLNGSVGHFFEIWWSSREGSSYQAQ